MEEKEFMYCIAYCDKDGLDMNGLPWLASGDKDLYAVKSEAEFLLVEGATNIHIFRMYEDCPEEITWDYVYRNDIHIEQKVLECIQWNGDNLKNVLGFTGKYHRFDEWFKSFEDFESYVKSHDNIFKLWVSDNLCYRVPVGAWLVKCPDGKIVPSEGIQDYTIGL